MGLARVKVAWAWQQSPMAVDRARAYTEAIEAGITCWYAASIVKGAKATCSVFFFCSRGFKKDNVNVQPYARKGIINRPGVAGAVL